MHLLKNIGWAAAFLLVAAIVTAAGYCIIHAIVQLFKL